jgi:hypothetical protein
MNWAEFKASDQNFRIFLKVVVETCANNSAFKFYLRSQMFNYCEESKVNIIMYWILKAVGKVGS